MKKLSNTEAELKNKHCLLKKRALYKLGKEELICNLKITMTKHADQKSGYYFK